MFYFITRRFNIQNSIQMYFQSMEPGIILGMSRLISHSCSCRELVFSTVYSKRSTLNLFQVFEDAACEREVLNLRVKCPSQGCPWTGELRNVKVKREVNLLKAKFADTFLFVL